MLLGLFVPQDVRLLLEAQIEANLKVHVTHALAQLDSLLDLLFLFDDAVGCAVFGAGIVQNRQLALYSSYLALTAHGAAT